MNDALAETLACVLFALCVCLVMVIGSVMTCN